MSECERGMQWKRITELIDSNQLHILGRSNAQNKVYAHWLTETCQQFHAPDDNILHTLFRFPTQLTADGKLECFNSIMPQNVKAIQLRANDFPYNFETSVMHCCLWSLRELNSTQIHTLLIHALGDKSLRRESDFNGDKQVVNLVDDFECSVDVMNVRLRVKEWTWFLNPKALKSIRNVWHIHVLIYLKE